MLVEFSSKNPASKGLNLPLGFGTPWLAGRACSGLSPRPRWPRTTNVYLLPCEFGGRWCRPPWCHQPWVIVWPDTLALLGARCAWGSMPRAKGGHPSGDTTPRASTHPKHPVPAQWAHHGASQAGPPCTQCTSALLGARPFLGTPLVHP